MSQGDFGSFISLEMGCRFKSIALCDYTKAHFAEYRKSYRYCLYICIQKIYIVCKIHILQKQNGLLFLIYPQLWSNTDTLYFSLLLSGLLSGSLECVCACVSERESVCEKARVRSSLCACCHANELQLNKDTIRHQLKITPPSRLCTVLFIAHSPFILL